MLQVLSTSIPTTHVKIKIPRISWLLTTLIILQSAIGFHLSTTAVRISFRKTPEVSMGDLQDAIVLGTITVEITIHLIAQIGASIPQVSTIRGKRTAINTQRYVGNTKTNCYNSNFYSIYKLLIP